MNRTQDLHLGRSGIYGNCCAVQPEIEKNILLNLPHKVASVAKKPEFFRGVKFQIRAFPEKMEPHFFSPLLSWMSMSSFSSSRPLTLSTFTSLLPLLPVLPLLPLLPVLPSSSLLPSSRRCCCRCCRRHRCCRCCCCRSRNEQRKKESCFFTLRKFFLHIFDRFKVKASQSDASAVINFWKRQE